MSETQAQLLSWPIPLAITFMLILVASFYLRGWLALRSAFPNLIAAWRLAMFMSGLLTVWIGIASPLATLDHQSLTMHMLKHLLLMTVAAPLILAGAPMFTLVCALPKLFINSYPALASLPERWLGNRLRNSALCWLTGTLTVIAWHIPGPFQLSMHSQRIHILADLSFLLAGLLFWWPIVQSSPSSTRSPRWSMALYLFLGTLPCDILSAFLVFCNRLVYPSHMSTPQWFSLRGLEDQECAGALMWVWVTFAYLIPAVAITVRMLSASNTQLQSPIRGMSNEVARRSPSDAEAGVL
jgi:cytochrome c oxidase assembly factor CtaG